MLSNIRIVLVHTFHPGNIGATARAMKTMGLTQLVLVNPRAFPDEEATRLAAGATDVLDNARCVSTWKTPCRTAFKWSGPVPDYAACRSPLRRAG